MSLPFDALDTFPAPDALAAPADAATAGCRPIDAGIPECFILGQSTQY